MNEQHIRVLIIGSIVAMVLLCLSGCSYLDNYDRSYSLQYGDAKATVTLKPRK